MAVLFKNYLQLFKHSLKRLGCSRRCLSSTRVQNVQNCSVIPLWSQKVNNFGLLRVFSGNFGLHITGVTSWYGEQSSVSVSLVSDCKDVLDCEEDLGVITECICCHVSNENGGLSEVMVNLLNYFYFKIKLNVNIFAIIVTIITIVIITTISTIITNNYHHHHHYNYHH